MRTTMAVDPHVADRRRTTSAASRIPPPPPPTSGLAVRPRSPASPRALTADDGKVPDSSVVIAAGATTSVITRSSASRWVLNGGLLSVSSTAATADPVVRGEAPRCGPGRPTGRWVHWLSGAASPYLLRRSAARGGSLVGDGWP